MNPAIHIRTAVFGCDTQGAFAALLGTTQTSISRWEGKGRIPGPRQPRVRELAHERGIPWDDQWFFDVPAREPAGVDRAAR